AAVLAQGEVARARLQRAARAAAARPRRRGQELREVVPVRRRGGRAAARRLGAVDRRAAAAAAARADPLPPLGTEVRGLRAGEGLRVPAGLTESPAKCCSQSPGREE